MSAVIVLILRILLSLLLFAMVGFTIFNLWKDIRKTHRVTSVQVVKPIYLQHDPTANTSARKYTEAEVLIGRDPACNFTIPDSAISAKHARLFFRQNQWWVEDSGSTNGTYLNQELVEAPVILIDGDQIKIGNHDILISILQISD
ncbi:MAG: FHA domain-containing protein [Anaerolineaceae bacterium]|nr:FHA domain-containing protein [Anaerolineaceae bacterium]